MKTGDEQGTDTRKPDIAAPWDGVAFFGFVGFLATHWDGPVTRLVGVLIGAMAGGILSSIYHRVQKNR